MEESKLSSLSKAGSLEEMGEFWDKHDFTDFDTDTPDAKFHVQCAVLVESDLLTQVETQAKKRGISVETLVNLWLQQKVVEAV